MNSFFSLFASWIQPNLIATGFEQTKSERKEATVRMRGTDLSLLSLSATASKLSDVKPLYIKDAILTTGVSGKEVLIRPLLLPLTKERDIEETLAFQSEALLPFPVQEAVLDYQILAKTDEETQITLLAVEKSALEKHISSWEEKGVHPERITSLPTAIGYFSAHFFPQKEALVALHFQENECCGCLIKEGKTIAAFALGESLSSLQQAKIQEEPNFTANSAADWQAAAATSTPLGDALKRLQGQVTRIFLALTKETKKEALAGLLITGEASSLAGLSEWLAGTLDTPLLIAPPSAPFSSAELHSFAFPIGLSLSALKSSIDFRKGDFAYPKPLRRIKKPLAYSLIALLALFLSFAFFSKEKLKNSQKQIKQEYLELLAFFGTSPENFETLFATKEKRTTPSSEEPFSLENLSLEQLSQRIAFLQKEFLSTPDSFPLFPNTPRVSDVLAWLTTHPALFSLNEKGEKQAQIEIEHFSYMMVKRPEGNKKHEKYQVKVEIEFSSPQAKMARKFHDALIAPNDWVDPKGEVKWNANHGTYQTSFFLKDKTSYAS